MHGIVMFFEKKLKYFVFSPMIPSEWFAKMVASMSGYFVASLRFSLLTLCLV